MSQVVRRQGAEPCGLDGGIGASSPITGVRRVGLCPNESAPAIGQRSGGVVNTYDPEVEALT